jgi:parallel beta-helix repeat protein
VNEDGGGVCNESTSVSLINCTIAVNSASNGGGISNRSSAPTIKNSILWGNTATLDGNQICNYSGEITLSYSCLAEGWNDNYNDGTFTSDNYINTNPRFINPNTDFRIAGDSPCADAGNDEYNNEDFDIRGDGYGRKLSKADASPGTIDMGAYEYNAGNDPPEPEVLRIYVKANASGFNDGTNWTDAYTSLQDALSASMRYFDIWVAAGTYYPTTGTDPAISFNMKNDVAIYGGFAGTETSLIERNIANNVTILSGNIGNPGVSTDNSYNVVYNYNVGSTAILDGFTIQGGWIIGLGGGISNEFSSPTIANCTITGNFAYNGGGISNSMASSPVLSNCTITSNSASNSGGGVFNSGSSATLINCAISGNNAASDGGGVSNSNSNTTLTNCAISGNSAQNGGGICNYGSSPELTNCTISGNSAIGDGGGIYNLSNSSPVLTNCTISGNTAGSNGGGVGNWNSLPLLINCLIYGNSANSGGGIYNSSSSALTNCTITENTAINGGGVYYLNSSSSSSIINNSIIWGNMASSNGNQIYYSNGTSTLSYSCYANETGDVHNDGGAFTPDAHCITTYPKFVFVAGNDYRIFGNSPCKNTGYNAYNSTTLDIRGQDRIQNTTIDMGAYEWTSGVDPGEVITWTGTGIYPWNWNAADNWSPNTVPSAISVAIIPNVATDPFIIEDPGTPAVCYDLTIETGAVLTIAVGKALTVNSTLTNSAGAGGLVIKSDVTGTGSLITSSTPDAIVERYINAWTNGAHGWHLLSSPVAEQVIDPPFTAIPATDYDFYKWDEPTNLWLNQKVGVNNITSFVPGTGYLVAYATAVTKQFTGSLNAANITVNGLTRTGTTYVGWNLLGNPFASALKWNDGINWTVPDELAATTKIWDEATAQYTDIAPNGFIPAMNGFMVQVLSGSSASLTIPALARVHNITAWYKNTEGEIKLIAHDPDNSTAQESIIKVTESATEGFDSRYDSHFLAGYAPLFYSIADSEQLSTNTLPGIDNSRIISMGFVKNAGTNFSIELTENSINGVSSVYLTDKKTGTITDLSKTNTYNFTASESDDASRFSLSFATTYGINPVINSGMQVYTYDKTLFITQTDPQKGTIWVYTASGQLLRSQSLESSTSQSISLQEFTQGVYMVTIHTDKSMYNQKVVVK